MPSIERQLFSSFVNGFKNRLKRFYITIGIISIPILYVLFLFFQLKISGVYAVATITHRGIEMADYEFEYSGKKYNGSLTGFLNPGEKYFVSFLKDNPDRNLLQYNDPVPNCLKDSIHLYWTRLPDCSNKNAVRHQ